MVGPRNWGGRHVRTLAPLFILGLILVSWDRLAAARQVQSAPERLAAGLVNALAGLAGGGYDSLAGSVRGVLTAGELARENERLREQNAELEARYTELFPISLENKQLAELLRLQRAQGGRGIAARIISVEAGTQAKRVTVNKGRTDGVGERHIAITSAGLVGRVVADQLAGNSAEVALIVDPRSGVAAMVAASGDKGIVVGQPSGPGLGGQMLAMDLAGDAVVRQGDLIVSSGLGGVYPRLLEDRSCRLRRAQLRRLFASGAGQAVRGLRPHGHADAGVAGVGRRAESRLRGAP